LKNQKLACKFLCIKTHSKNDTSWTESDVSSVNDIITPVFNPENAFWMNYKEKFQTLCDVDFPETMPTPAGVLGPFDILAGLTSSELLCIECLINPEKVLEKTELWADMFRLGV